MAKLATVTAIGGECPTNGGKATLDLSIPYTVNVAVQGCADILFHRWNSEAVDAKAKSAKGSKSKKSDDIESYVYRTDDGNLAIPGEYLRMSMVNAAKFRQDPRSPRKSAMDLFKAAVICLTPLADLGVDKWDYEDRRRAVVQRNGINRSRPAILSGWRASFDLLVNLPEYVGPELLNGVIQDAGRLVGLGDFRPTYGRFNVVNFVVSS
jgi:hypothetical protein